MKIQIASDLHLEYYDVYPGINFFLEPCAPILVLAGDICYYKHPHFLTFFREASFYFKHVIFVPGNHEYYTSTIIDLSFDGFSRVDDEIDDILCNLQNVHILQKSTFTIGNIKFIGTTLWCDIPDTDTRLQDYAVTQNENFVLYNNHLMPHPKLVYNTNRDQYNWLKNELNYCKDYYTIVVTHYLPSKKCISEEFKNASDNYLFYSRCDRLFQYTNTWVYGHTHIGKKMYDKHTIVLANPKGLPSEQNKYDKYKYDMKYTIDVPSFSMI